MNESAILTPRYPLNLTDNVSYRENLLIACEKDTGLRSEIMSICADDIFFWMDIFGWTFDPRKDPRIIPFILYEEFQRSYISDVCEAIENQHDMLTEKSRDMGVSWMVLCVFLHKWRFKQGSTFRVGSRKEEEVDKTGSIGTLFEKMRFYLKRLPIWMLPESFDWRKHGTYMKLINPVEGSVIIGEATNENFGRGARDTAILMDEFAVWDCDDSAWTACADTTKCRLPVSTPNGPGNKFAVLARGTKEKIKVRSLHWTLHPEKALGAYHEQVGDKIPVSDCHEAFSLWKRGTRIYSPWYDVERKRRSAQDLAQEVDINYLESGSPFFAIRSLEKQLRWEKFERKNPGERIPHGKFIRGKVIELDHKVVFRDQDAGWLKVFEAPENGRQYVIAMDSSEGLPKGDEATLIVREKITKNTVASANGMYPPEELAWMGYLVGEYYFGAEIAPENNNHGYTTCKEVEDLGGKLYFMRKDETTGNQNTPKRGWTTQVRSRALMLDDMAKEIDHESVELRDPDLIDQCFTFSQNEKGKPESAGDFLDDFVIAFAICGEVIREHPYKKHASRNTRMRGLITEKRKAKNAGYTYSGRK